MISHSMPTLAEDEQRAVSSVIHSGYVAQGPRVEAFESALARRIGAAGAVALSSGTASLHLALKALGAGPGTEVIIPSYVCTAVLNAVNHTGATALLADCDEFLNISPESIRRLLSSRTRAIVAAHLFGSPAHIDKIVQLGPPVVEDCAQSLGATYRGRACGSLTQLSIFSFYATKVICTGEGGMVAGTSPELVARIRDWREYDKRDDYVVRYNYKMTDVAAAMGEVQLEKLNGFLRRRAEIARRYDDAFKSMPFWRPAAPPESESIYFRYWIWCEGHADGMIRKMQSLGVRADRPVFRPIHQLVGHADCPTADRAHESVVSIPIYPALSDADVDRVIGAVRKTY